MSETQATPYDEVGNIIAYEEGELDGPEIIELFSYLLKNGKAFVLQGSYGRMAMRLIDNGYLSPEGDILTKQE